MPTTITGFVDNRRNCVATNSAPFLFTQRTPDKTKSMTMREVWLGLIFVAVFVVSTVAAVVSAPFTLANAFVYVFFVLSFALLVNYFTLFRAVGDATNDLAHRMTYPTMLLASKIVYGHAEILHNKFNEQTGGADTTRMIWTATDQTATLTIPPCTPHRAAQR